MSSFDDLETENWGPGDMPGCDSDCDSVEMNVLTLKMIMMIHLGLQNQHIKNSAVCTSLNPEEEGPRYPNRCQNSYVH